MRIVLHAGLHKSGTTSVQQAWRAAYADGDRVRYPTRERGRVPGHHYLTWPLLRAFTHATAPDLLSKRVAAPSLGDLAKTVRKAGREGVHTLVLSSEDLDRITEHDVPLLAAALGEHPVTVMLTVTPPAHRWCAGWQELVKHGMADYPADDPGAVLDFAALRVGRLEQLLRLLPAEHRLVRLVRPSPPEEDLPVSLARAVGLAPLPRPAPGTSNTSLGTDIEILRRLNRVGATTGFSAPARATLDELRSRGLRYEEDASLANKYEFPDAFHQAAEAEQDFLRDPGHVEVADPHRLLPSWSSQEPPTWYREISMREVVAPELDRPVDLGEELWRARQRISAYERRIEKLEKQVSRLRGDEPKH